MFLIWILSDVVFVVEINEKIISDLWRILKEISHLRRNSLKLSSFMAGFSGGILP